MRDKTARAELGKFVVWGVGWGRMDEREEGVRKRDELGEKEI